MNQYGQLYQFREPPFRRQLGQEPCLYASSRTYGSNTANCLTDRSLIRLATHVVARLLHTHTHTAVFNTAWSGCHNGFFCPAETTESRYLNFAQNSQTRLLGYARNSTQYIQRNNRSPNNHRRNQNAPRLHVPLTTISILAVSMVMVRAFAGEEELNTIWFVRDSARILTWSETRHRLAAH